MYILLVEKVKERLNKLSIATYSSYKTQELDSPSISSVLSGIIIQRQSKGKLFQDEFPCYSFFTPFTGRCRSHWIQQTGQQRLLLQQSWTKRPLRIHRQHAAEIQIQTIKCNETIFQVSSTELIIMSNL